MSMLQRANSFVIAPSRRKNKNGTQQSQRKSVSMEMLHREMATNQLFRNQRAKYIICDEQKPVSNSWSDVTDGERIRLPHFHFRVTTSKNNENTPTIEELLSSVQDVPTSTQIDQNSASHDNKPKNFPITSLTDDKVELRQRPTPQRLARSKTVDFVSRSHKKTDSDRFVFKNATKMTFCNEKVVKLRRNQRFVYEKGNIFVENGEIIKNNVKLNPGAKTLPNKKQVVMTDGDENIYHIHFETSKDAKQFVEFEQKFLPLAMTSPSLQSEKRTIKRTLLGLLGRRASRDVLESRGIIRNEPIFGNTLSEVVRLSEGIPDFIRITVELIELPTNIKSIGIYRTPGNLAVIQKIRCHVDLYKLGILEQYRNDVDVLTGCLKMFFRELKEPVISRDVCNDIYIMLSEGKALTDDVIFSKLSQPTCDVLDYLLRHLAKVCQYKDDNKMDVHNMAICWGPSLIGHTDHCTDDVFIQTSKISKVMEGLINHYYKKISNNHLPKMTDVKIIDDVYDIVKKLTDLIELNLTVEGIYRKSGSAVKIDNLITKINQKQNIQDLNLSNNDVHDLCCVLKRYLANLDPPLITEQQFDGFCIRYDEFATSESKKQLQVALDFVETLPRRDCLLLLVAHLQKVSNCSADNKMTLSQIASLFTLTLMPQPCRRKKDKEETLLTLLTVLLKNDQKNLPDLVRLSTYDNMATVDIANVTNGQITYKKTDDIVNTKL